MSNRTPEHEKAATQTQTHAPAGSTRLVQRKCACGGIAGLNASCDDCRSKQLSLQRNETAGPNLSSAAPNLNHVLSSPGRPLDPVTLAFMEPRFGHDFSQVRIHADADAAASAKALNANAYTVGQQMVFAEGKYAPGTQDGNKLLAHELTHTIQQEKASPSFESKLEVSQPGDPAELEAEAASEAVLLQKPVTVQPGIARHIARNGPDAGAPVPAPLGISAGVITGGVTGLTMDVTGTYSTCTNCTDGLEAIQVAWALGGPRVGTHTTVFPPLSATYYSFVDGGRNSPGGATYSGDHPYYIGRPSLPARYGYNSAQGSAGTVTGCTARVRDTPTAVTGGYTEAYFETAFVCLNNQGSGQDRLLESFQWGFINSGTAFKPNAYNSGTNIVRLSTPSDKFKETLGADYPGYSYVV